MILGCIFGSQMEDGGVSEFAKTLASDPCGAGYARCVPSGRIPTSTEVPVNDLERGHTKLAGGKGHGRSRVALVTGRSSGIGRATALHLHRASLTAYAWSAPGIGSSSYDVLSILRKWADDVHGQALDCGHSLAEEWPSETATDLVVFLTGPP
jgi:hypothetical protein